MLPVEPSSIATALAAKTGDAALDVAKEQAQSLLKSLLGPVATSAGELLALPVREWQFNNVIKTLARTQSKFKAAGINPKSVSLKIIHPLLENVALEPEPELQERWSNLLANEADPRKSESGGVAFVSILKEFTAREARFLDAFLESVECTDDTRPLVVMENLPGYTDEQLFEVYSGAGLARDDVDASVHDYNRMMDLLIRNRIFSSFAHPEPLEIVTQGGFRVVAAISPIKLQTKLVYRITDLGWSFLFACRAPVA